MPSKGVTIAERHDKAEARNNHAEPSLVNAVRHKHENNGAIQGLSSEDKAALDKDSSLKEDFHEKSARASKKKKEKKEKKRENSIEISDVDLTSQTQQHSDYVESIESRLKKKKEKHDLTKPIKLGSNAKDNTGDKMQAQEQEERNSKISIDNDDTNSIDLQSSSISMMDDESQSQFISSQSASQSVNQGVPSLLHRDFDLGETLFRREAPGPKKLFVYQGHHTEMAEQVKDANIVYDKLKQRSWKRTANYHSSHTIIGDRNDDKSLFTDQELSHVVLKSRIIDQDKLCHTETIPSAFDKEWDRFLKK